MGINVYLADSKGDIGNGDYERVGIEIEEGPYFFLWTEIESLKKSHGKFIDLYGDVFFEPHAIPPLLAVLKPAHLRAQKMGKMEKVATGFDPETKKEVFVSIPKDATLDLVQRLIRAAEQAESQKKLLVFLGD